MVGATDEQDPGIGHLVEPDRAERHRVRLRHAGVERLVVPALPLHHRIGIDVVDIQPGRLVLHASIPNRVAHSGTPITVMPRM